ncbi:PH (Pleckstrin Homology) domain-containing protein [Nocardia pseudobrasiliensis]|uniref:PH (Pleckstrin Homology) domain-containing protein n=1 Tax=Nocardia pseudobrasiliensis TaxID=45979 RepID=A0A370IF85_9NOCA|nr:PH (Pleckstrin Homology) domain-containing protein [Nocardia pseudobrasiliensis]
MPSPHRSVPPARSSHTPDTGSDTGRVIRISRLGHLGVFVLLFCVMFAFFGWPQVLWVLFVIPIAIAVWVERTRTTVSAAGLDLRTVFGSRHVDWDQIKGLRIPKRGFVRAHLADDSEVALPAVAYDRLRLLIEASNGRIPDLFTEAEDAEREKAARERAEAQAERESAAQKKAEAEAERDKATQDKADAEPDREKAAQEKTEGGSDPTGSAAEKSEKSETDAQ